MSIFKPEKQVYGDREESGKGGKNRLANFCPSPFSSPLLHHEGRWGTTDDFTTSFFHFSLFSAALWDLLSSTYSSACLVFFTLSLCLARWLRPDLTNGRHDIALQFESLYDGQVFVWSDGLLDLGTDFLVGNMVSV